ncbi:AzlD domain-containing protein [Aquabacterium sp.]|uniref:AzlD domain-containing protein n=1 Tax=Aquabacterium sp. TaxID=1872578 RepID=UPI002E342821|nr:AzlD domain-containing protein [Aquabacterium sp.]HEX5311406.1 AzlD domain-containing protein [Aquabacterium sp.]
MSELEQAIVVVGLVIISVVTRSFFFLQDRPWPFPRWLDIGLSYAPIGALAAVAVPAVLLEPGAHDLVLDPSRVGAALSAVAIAVRRKDMLMTIAVGMLTFHILHVWGV